VEPEVPLCDIFVSWGLRLVSKLYPVVSPFDARGSSVAYVYFTVTYLIWLSIWLTVAIMATAICLVIDAFYILLRPIIFLKQFVTAKFTRIVRASVSSLLSFTPLQRCELLSSIHQSTVLRVPTIVSQSFCVLLIP